MKPKQTNLEIVPVEELIRVIRGQRVILDADLARVYGVPTKQINQAIKRNPDRFPVDFAFQLKPQEVASLRSQIVTSKGRGGRRYIPIAFTEHGAIMAANVLNSPRAVQMSVFVVRAFVKMREALAQNKGPEVLNPNTAVAFEETRRKPQMDIDRHRLKRTWRALHKFARNRTRVDNTSPNSLLSRLCSSVSICGFNVLP